MLLLDMTRMMQETRGDCLKLHLRRYKRIMGILKTTSLSKCRRCNSGYIIWVRTRQDLCKGCGPYPAELCTECNKNELASNLVSDEDVVAAFLVADCSGHGKNVPTAAFSLNLQLAEFGRQLDAIDVRGDKDLV